jgi:hypothetical protein
MPLVAVLGLQQIETFSGVLVLGFLLVLDAPRENELLRSPRTLNLGAAKLR